MQSHVIAELNFTLRKEIYVRANLHRSSLCEIYRSEFDPNLHK